VKALGLLDKKDCVIFVGSMGSCSKRINLGDFVLPNPCLCAYYGFDGIQLHQGGDVLQALYAALHEENKTAMEYLHGSSFAVFDPHTDHDAYTIDLYDGMVEGVDCAEVFIGLDFAQRMGISAGVLLYCSDSPLRRIRDIPVEEFSIRAAEGDLTINRTAARAISIWNAEK
jgi:nucleoside phosphorylase